MIRVLKYGVRSLVAHRDEAIEEMSKAHHYYNALLELRLRESRGYREIRSRYVPELATVEAELKEIQEQVDSAYEAIRARRKRASAPTAPGEDASPQKLEATEEERAEIRRLKELRGQAAKRGRTLRPQFEALLKPARDAFDARTSGAPAELLAQIQEIGRQLKEAKKTRKNPDVPRLKAALDELKKRKKSFGESTHRKRAVNLRVRAEMMSEPEWHPAWKAVEQLRHEVHEESLRLRDESGLAHGAYIAVEGAVSQALETADFEPRFQRWDGGRKIGLQFQPAMTGREFYAGGDTRLRVLKVEKSASTGKRSSSHEYALVALPLGKGKAKSFVTAEVLIHRRVPDDALIKWAYLVPKRIGFRMTYTLQLTAQLQAPMVAREYGDGEAIVRLGWSREPGNGEDRGIIVATVNGEPVKLHARAYSAMLLARALRGAADKHFDHAREQLAAWAKSNKDAPEWLVEALGGVHQWRNHGKLAVIAKRWVEPMGDRVKDLWFEWRAHRDSTGSDYHEEQPAALAEWLTGKGVASPSDQMGIWLEWWRRKDQHLIQWAADTDTKARRRRKNDYRVAAAQLAERYGRVAIMELDLAEAAERKTPDRDADELHQQARYQRTCACPSEFKESLAAVFGPDRFREIKRERSGDAPDPGGARNDDDSAENKGDDVASDKAAE